MSKIIGIASDHGGFEMKQYLRKKLIQLNFEVIDFGTHSEESVDYPDFIHPISKEIDEGNLERGIIVCGSGNGASMTANKYSNIRAALCWNVELGRLARLHNDANILALPGRFISKQMGGKILKVFLETDFEGGRHQNRIKKMKNSI